MRRSRLQLEAVIALAIAAGGCRSSIKATSGATNPAKTGPVVEEFYLSGKLIDAGWSLADAACKDPSVSLLTAQSLLEKARGSSDAKIVATAAMAADGGFKFSESAIASAALASPHVLLVDDCSTYRLRFVSSVAGQDLSRATTTIAAAIDMVDLRAVAHGTSWYESLETLQEAIANTVGGNDTLATIRASAALAKAYHAVFGFDVDVMQRVPPFFAGVEVPARVGEKSSLLASARAVHWDQSVKLAFFWELDGKSIGQGGEIEHQLKADDQGTRRLRVTVGTADGKGKLRQEMPMRSLELPLVVGDAVPAVVPDFVVLSDVANAPTPVVTGAAIRLAVDTGIGRVGCSTFTKMAVTESGVTPGSAAFTLQCKQAPQQILTHTLKSTAPGERTIALWVIDSAGVVATVPKTATFIYDHNPVAASIVGWPTSDSNDVAPSGIVAGSDVVAYRHKWGPALTTDCTVEADYGAETDVATAVTADLSATPDGALHLCLVGRRANNKPQPFAAATVIAWTKDTVAPAAAVNGVPSGTNNATTLNATVASTDGAVAYRYKVGELATTDCTDQSGYGSETPVATAITPSIAPLADGDVRLCVVTRDAAGNWQPFSSATLYEWYKNTATPTAAASGVPVSQSNVTTLNVSVSGTDVIQYVYKIGPQASTSCTNATGYSTELPVATPITDDISGLADGSIKLCLRGISVANNWQVLAGASTYTWTKDTTPPAAFSITQPATATNDTTPTIAWGAATGATVYDVAIGTGASCTGVVADQTGVSGTSWTPSALAEGSYFVCVTARDAAGNTTAATNTSKALTIDTTPPAAFSISGPAALDDDDTPTVTWAVATGATTYDVNIDSNGDCTAPFVQSHAAVVGTSVTLTSVSDGSYRVCVTATDSAGNLRQANNNGTYSFAVDTTAPTVTVTDYTAPKKGGAAVVQWALTEVNASSVHMATIEISDDGSTWQTLATPVLGVNGPLTAQTYSTNVTLPAWDVTTARIRVSYTDGAGLSSSDTSAIFTIDSTAPTVAAIELNDGDASANSNYLRVDLSAEDDGPAGGTNVTHFCLLYSTSTQPAANASCWLPVDAPQPGVATSNNIAFADFYYAVGFTPATYTVHAFVKDRAGNVSSLSNSGSGTSGVDRKSIAVYPGQAPVVTRVVATNTAAPSNPPTVPELQVASGSTVYIKWRATDVEGLGATPISISYTTSGSTFTAVATGLANGSNGGCTVDDPGTTVDDQATGCYVWTSGSPMSTNYRVRVSATDDDGMLGFGQSELLNVTHFRFVAGSTENGLGGSASAAVFQITSEAMRLQKLVVHPSGKIFVLDNRGLMLVDPTTGIQQLLINTTGAFAGNGVPVTAATLRQPYRLALDYQGRLLISDYDRIRRVDVSASPMTISTVIGGGTLTADGTAALDLAITASGFAYARLIPLPNGDILFQSTNHYAFSPAAGARIRRYEAATGTVSSIGVSGTAPFMTLPAANIAACLWRSFAVETDPSTSEITRLVVGMTPTTTAGGCFVSPTTGGYGDYVEVDLDTQLATSLEVPPLWDSAFNRFFGYDLMSGLDGRLYAFAAPAATNPGHRHARVLRLESGGTWTQVLGTYTQGECPDGTPALACNVRIDSLFVDAAGKIYILDDGTVRTVQDDGTMLTLAGQRRSHGDGGAATDARFSDIIGMAMWRDGASDRLIVTDVANLTIRELTLGGTIQKIAGNSTYGATNTTTDAVAQPINLGSDQRNAGMSVDTNGDITMILNQGQLGKLVRSTGKWTLLNTGLSGYGPHVLAASPGKILLGTYQYVAPLASVGNSELYEFDLGTSTRTRTVYKPGDNAFVSQFCAAGVSLTDCLIPPATGSSYINAGGWDPHAARWYMKATNTSRIVKFASSGTMETLTTLPRTARNFAYRRSADLSTNVVYYCGSDGLMYKYNINTSTEAPLTYPTTGMSCSHNSIVIYSPERDSVIVNLTIGGLQTVGEFFNP